MVSWKGAAALLVLLVAAIAYLALNRSQPPTAAARLFACEEPNMVGLLVEGAGGRSLEITRGAVGDQWRVTRPVAAAADQEAARTLAQDLHSIVPESSVSQPGSLAEYGLDAPREIVTCRVKDGSSYTLTVGKETFDGGGYYGLKGGDPRVYVISSVPIDDFDRNLKEPPVKAGTS